MVKKKGKKIVVQTGKQQNLQERKTLLPLFESPFEIFDDINRMYYGDSWMKPWWNRWMMNQTLGISPENRMKLIPVDLIDTGNAYEIITELPGVNKKDIEIMITSRTMSICGVTETNIRNEKKGYIKKERGYSTLCRYLRFPEDVDPDNAEAVLNDGVLQINVRKKTPSERSIRLPVK